MTTRDVDESASSGTVTECTLEARGLRRRFGSHLAVDGIDFVARRGEVLGLLGPNGAGKTTTLRMLAGLLSPTDGQVLLDGRDLFTSGARLRRGLAYLPEDAAPYGEMAVAPYLSFMARMWGVRRRDVSIAVDVALRRLELVAVRRQVIATLSKGFRQRVAIAGAIVHDPQVLLLDEATSGLDPKQVVDFRNLVRDLAGDRVVLLSTHRLSEAEQLSDRVLVIARGKQVALAAPGSLTAGLGPEIVELHLEGEPGVIRRVVASVPSATVIDVEVADEDAGPGRLHVRVRCASERRGDLVRALVTGEIGVFAVTPASADLEAAFLQLTS